MKSRIAIVTGGAGFIGSHMTDLLLAEGFQVRVIDDLSTGQLANLEQHKGEVRLRLDDRDLRTIPASDDVFKDVEYVFHFAGRGDIVPSIDKPVDYMSVNVMGTVHALEGARTAGVKKFVYAASSSCYGLAKEVPTTENAPIETEYPYALSKYLGEQSAFHWGRVYRMAVNSVRIFNAYGPRSRTTGAYGAVFGVFLKQKLAKKPFTVVGDGTQTRDFVFVTDLARAFYAAAETERCGQVYNVGTGNPQSVNRLVELLEGYGVVHLPKRPGEPDCTWADISKIKRELAWQPLVPIEEGVKQMLRHIDAWQNAPLWDETSIAAATKGWFEALSSRK